MRIHTLKIMTWLLQKNLYKRGALRPDMRIIGFSHHNHNTFNSLSISIDSLSTSLRYIMHYSKIAAMTIAAFVSTVVADNCFEGYLYCSGNLLSQGKRPIAILAHRKIY